MSKKPSCPNCCWISNIRKLSTLPGRLASAFAQPRDRPVCRARVYTRCPIRRLSLRKLPAKLLQAQRDYFGAHTI
jgi:hypothetical protein